MFKRFNIWLDAKRIERKRRAIIDHYNMRLLLYSSSLASFNEYDYSELVRMRDEELEKLNKK